MRRLPGLAARSAGQADFVHVGPSEHDQSDALTEEEVAAASASGTVRFVGAVDDVRPYLASATVVVLPSYREGIPRVAMEAAAMGRPVVAYDIRGVREVIDPASGSSSPAGTAGAGRTWSEICCRTRPVRRARCAGAGRGWWSASPRTRSSSGCGPSTPASGWAAAGDMSTEVLPDRRRRGLVRRHGRPGRAVPAPGGARSGLTGLADLLDGSPDGDPTVTLFVVGNYADAVATELDELVARGHEVASHGPDHGRLPEDPDGAGRVVARGAGRCSRTWSRRPVQGFRSPRFDMPGHASSLGRYRELWPRPDSSTCRTPAGSGPGRRCGSSPCCRARVPDRRGQLPAPAPGGGPSDAVGRGARPRGRRCSTTTPTISEPRCPASASIRSLAVAKQLVGRGRVAAGVLTDPQPVRQ